MKLRSKKPYWCRHERDGKLDCLTVPLTEAEGDLCARHQAEKEEAERRFFEAPVRGPRPEVEVVARKVWP